MEFVSKMKGVKCIEPDGAFYIFPEISYYFGKTDGETTIKNSPDLCMHLINKANVSTVMGDAFGAPNNIRISFANSMENIEKGYSRIVAALEKLH